MIPITSLSAWLFLFSAIFFEVGATSLLNISDGFRKPGPTAGALSLYTGAFFCLSRALRYIPIGLAYAIWCGIGIICIVTIGVIIFKQPLSLPAYGGIALIILGTIIASLSGSMRE